MVIPVFYALYFLNFYNYPQCTDYFNNQGRRETRLTQGVPCATTPAPTGRDLDLSSLGLVGYPQAAASGFTFNSNMTTTTSNPSLFFHFSSSNPQATASSPSQEIESYGFYIKGTCHILDLFRPEYRQQRSNTVKVTMVQLGVQTRGFVI